MLPRYSSHHPIFKPLISPPTDFVYTSTMFSICGLWGLVFLKSRTFALPFPLGRNSGSFFFLTIQLRKSYLFCYLGRNFIKKNKNFAQKIIFLTPSTFANGFMKWGIKGVSPPTNAQKMRRVRGRKSFWTAHARLGIETIFCFSIQIHGTKTFIIFFYTIKILFL